ncbi:MAG: hypothetical protein ACI9XO_003366 [Paraglaciecola sp.]|jgi:hypothetical protein
MIDKIKNSLQLASGMIKEQAATLSDSAKERGYRLIEDWITVLPKFEEMGFEITSFAVGISISPILEVEMTAEHEQFPVNRIEEILEDNKISTPISLVFNTIKTTYNLHARAECSIKEPLIVKIRVKMPPEIKVFLGMPKLV